MAIFESAIFWIVVAAASEIIALTSLRSNSVIQLVLQALRSIKPSEKGLIPEMVWLLFTTVCSEQAQRLAQAQKFYNPPS